MERGRENPPVLPCRKTGFPALPENVRNRGFLKSGVSGAKRRVPRLIRYYHYELN